MKCKFLLLVLGATILFSCNSEKSNLVLVDRIDTVRTIVNDTLYENVVIRDTIKNLELNNDGYYRIIERFKNEYLLSEKSLPKFIDEISEVIVEGFPLNSDEDERNEIIVLQSIVDKSTDERVAMNNLYYLDYIYDRYIVLDSICSNELNFYNFDSNLFTGDIDGDNLDEVILDYRTVFSAGSNFYKSDVVDFNNDRLEIREGVNARYKVFNEKFGYYFLLNPIANPEEGRLGSHQYWVKKMIFKNEKFTVVDSFMTKEKYPFGEEDKYEIISDAMSFYSAKLSKRNFEVELLSINMISNDHVGNEWVFYFTVNETDSQGSKSIVSLGKNQNLVVKSHASETNEKFNDFGTKSFVIKLDKLDTFLGRKIRSYVTVIEKNGRFSGNIAEFEFVYVVNEIDI